MSNYGFFVSYRRSYASFAGRIYDYLTNKGFAPFMDIHGLKQGHFDKELENRIMECPYFLLVLSKGCFRSRSGQPGGTDYFINEISFALKNKPFESIFVVCEEGFDFYHETLPEEVKGIRPHQCDTLHYQSFAADLESMLSRNIDVQKLKRVVNWRDMLIKNGSTLVGSRSLIENEYATLENRFGKDLLAAVREHRRFEGKNIVRQIRMSCYAANIVFNPFLDEIDDKAFDNGMIFNTFGELLRDPEFSLEIIINAPDSVAAQEAVRNDMLGNRKFEEHAEAVFYSSYNNIVRLITEDEVFRKAYEEKRFRYHLTDAFMTGAIFQVVYKDGYGEFDHIKYDLYTYDLISSMDRRCMVFFRRNDPETYEHLERCYDYIKKRRYSKETIAKKHEDWKNRWEQLKKEI